MYSAVNKKTLRQVFVILKWGKIAAKIAAIGTTVTGAITAFTSSSAATGIAMGAAGATTYAATKNLAAGSYEKTKHIAPGAPVRENVASRTILAAGNARKLSKSEASIKASSPVKSAGAAPENPFAWTEEENATGSLADKSQQSLPFFERPPMMVVTTEEEEEFDEAAAKTKRIRRTALNFVAQGENTDKN